MGPLRSRLAKVLSAGTRLLDTSLRRPSDQSSRRLRPLLAPGLRVVFVGVGPRPGGASLQTGHYFEDTNNVFYSSLHDAGLTKERLDPEQDVDLLQFGVGLDDVCADPAGLAARLAEVRPGCVCFNSKEALAVYSGRRSRLLSRMGWQGDRAGRIASFSWGPLVWAVPDSSGKASRFYSERVRLLKDLCRVLCRRSLGRHEDLPQPDPSTLRTTTFTPDEVARMLGVSPKTVRARCRRMFGEQHELYQRWELTREQVRRLALSFGADSQL